MESEALVQAYQFMIDVRRSHATHGPEIVGYHPYELCNDGGTVNFNVPFVERQIRSDLREIINCQNRWVTDLHKWRAWNRVLPEYGPEEQWDLRIEFADSVARGCMLEPSAMRDRALRALNFALHHASLTVDAGYRDVLDGDAQARRHLEAGKASHAKYLSRREQVNQVREFAQRWPQAGPVLDLLERVDDDAYRQASMDYRSASSHSIAPHFEMGVVPCVIRSATLPSGVSYGFGERPPLRHVEAFAANRLQLAAMRNALMAYESLLCTVFESVGNRRLQ